MNDNEIRCLNCNNIFILRGYKIEQLKQKNIVPKYCPICRTEYSLRKAEARKRLEDEAWQLKKAEDKIIFEERLKDWSVITLKEAVLSNESKRLYVIGNGFDMMHGAKSSYYDFNKTIGRNSQLRFCLEHFLDVEDLWADFEGALSKIRVDMMCSPYIIDMFLESMGAYDEDAGAAEFYGAAEMAAGPIITMNEELRKRFEAWIRRIETGTEDRPLAPLIKKDGKFLSFNYTEFLEDLYGIEEQNICYIHGCRRKKKGFPGERLILGHMPGASDSQYDFKDNYRGIPRKHTQLVYDAQQIALNHVVQADEELTKNCQDIISKHIDFFEGLFDLDYIITIGHSLYPVDWDYFEKIMEVVRDRTQLRWIIGCHCKADLERIEIFADRFNIEHRQIQILRTDLIPVRFKEKNTVSENKERHQQKKRVLAASDDRKWKIIKEGKCCKILNVETDNIVLSRIFSTDLSGAVFTPDGNNFLLVARGIYRGVFLFRLVGDDWEYAAELEEIPNQGVMNKRLQRIIVDDDQIVFVYNSRVRIYSLENGDLLLNKGVQKANLRQYKGLDITERFRKIYKTGFY